jgi:H+-transporting ATPase
MAAKSPLHINHTDLAVPAAHLTSKVTPEERQGLTSVQVEQLITQWGYNELPEIQISLLYMFFLQFTGTMPYMLELAAVIALAVNDYTDFGIIVAMLLANGFLGFHEQLKAAESLVSIFLHEDVILSTPCHGNAVDVHN